MGRMSSRHPRGESLSSGCLVKIKHGKKAVQGSTTSTDLQREKPAGWTKI